MNVNGTANISKDGKGIEVEVKIQADKEVQHERLSRVAARESAMVNGFLVLKELLPIVERRNSQRKLSEGEKERRLVPFAYGKVPAPPAPAIQRQSTVQTKPVPDPNVQPPSAASAQDLDAAVKEQEAKDATTGSGEQTAK